MRNPYAQAYSALLDLKGKKKLKMLKGQQIQKQISNDYIELYGSTTAVDTFGAG